MISLLAARLIHAGVFLIVAPLSTLSHWQREFNRWTELNTIVYHGSTEDRKLIRQFEMAYECDRPQNAVGFNQLYLKKCAQKSNKSPWMAQVVITTPETLVAEDFLELTVIQWDVLVVDEAHRLKNHNSKLAVNMRDKRFTFDHKVLLTGTPIQNDVKEFWYVVVGGDLNREMRILTLFCQDPVEFYRSRRL
jgi:SNF2 family DNA or RNA helicase